jgi:predicted flap endonuclease-1-like 5' DNA nuclease/glutathione synthase/RimK-type ligase-like ATP-grasp enzyme
LCIINQNILKGKTMKKIGILFGMETTFPPAFVERVNQKAKAQKLPIMAEFVTVDKVQQASPTEYAVIIDRISQDVPFYRAYLKNAAICGTAVINNPFWWSADEKFFNNALAERIGVPVPRTVLLPSKVRPDDTSEMSFRNLKFPLSWREVFDYVGFPAFMKPHAGGGWKSVYKLDSEEDFFKAYSETGQLVMMLQEAIEFDAYFRCYCIGRQYVRIMQYEPRNPHHLRYVADHKVTPALLATIEKYVLALCEGLGYDFNTVEFAVRDGVPIAIDFCNPAPDADIHSVGAENFEWVVETMATYAIERALAHKDGQDNLSWGSYLRGAASSGVLPTNTASTGATSTSEAAPKKKVTKAANSDDLTLIEGIGPKIADILRNEGIDTFTKLAKTKADKIKDILVAAGSRYKMHDPTTWAAQAKLAADGKMDELEQLKKELIGGKTK